MHRSILFLVIGIFAGGIISHWAGRMIPSAAAAPKRPEAKSTGTLKYPLHSTLYRFTLNKSNMDVYQQWVRWHHEAYQPMIATLEREKMYFESVFRDTANEPGVIYWLAIDGEGGANSTSSTSEIDKKHVEYMKQILVKGSRVTLKTEFTLIPSFIDECIDRHQQTEK
ncbi:MAG TPA: DUF6176 family protein [Puia sp.]|uniref:DUF6176 family protein n=1 Tax=Puia sp. TaxID=2045100 RepID=UPI002C8CCA6C|nr:DUF6176 family protein [Puia sp.]HVU98714.1 DUF6176 family protein [Puia sp.]